MPEPQHVWVKRKEDYSRFEAGFVYVAISRPSRLHSKDPVFKLHNIINNINNPPDLKYRVIMGNFLKEEPII